MSAVPRTVAAVVALALGAFTIASADDFVKAGKIGTLGMVEIHVTLKDHKGRELPVGPVALELSCTDPVKFSSRFHARASDDVWIMAPQGKCLLESTSPYQFEGKRYTWRRNVQFDSGERRPVNLSAENALVNERYDPAADPPASPETATAGAPSTTGSDAPAFPTSDVILPENYFAIAPEYPDVMRRARIQGYVIMQAVINADGKVSEARVLKSTNPQFDEPALKAVTQRKYKPAIQHGKPVAIYFTVRTDFRLR